MKELWNERYSQKEYIYGRQPNDFLKTYLDNYIPGKILLPAEGEGRNAVYAAQLGWDVYALDFSEEAKKKALAWATQSLVKINYEIADLTQWQTKIEVDLIALVYAHFSPAIRQKIHEKLIGSLKPGGIILLEAFSKKQLEYDSGGPGDPELLYNEEILKSDFKDLKIEFVQERIVELNEGRFLQGDASVIRMMAKKA